MIRCLLAMFALVIGSLTAPVAAPQVPQVYKVEVLRAAKRTEEAVN